MHVLYSYIHICICTCIIENMHSLAHGLFPTDLSFAETIHTPCLC